MLNCNDGLTTWLLPPEMTLSTGPPSGFAPTGKGGGAEWPARTMTYFPFLRSDIVM